MRAGKFLLVSSVGLLAGTSGNLAGYLLRVAPSLRGLVGVLFAVAIITLVVFGFLLDEKTAHWTKTDIEVVHIGTGLLLVVLILSAILGGAGA